MYKDFIMQTAGIELAPLISLCVFVIFFVLLTIRVLSYSKAQVKELGDIPLDDKNPDLNTDYNV
jgi:hypothetical protein